MNKTALDITSDDTDRYPEFLQSIQDNFLNSTLGKQHLFYTSAPGLFDLFLEGLPPERRQHYRCNACRHFVERYGTLVSVDPDGKTHSVLWDHTAVPSFFHMSVSAMKAAVESSAITGVLVTDRGDPHTWGQPITGDWRHMAVIMPVELAVRLVNKNPTLNAAQVMAEKRQEHGMLRRGLADFGIETVRKAKAILETDALYRAEKCLGVASWLLNIHEVMSKERNRVLRDNQVWVAVAGAPPGWCHVRTTMIGTLLEDLAIGMPIDQVTARFKDKMNPLQYQRPTAEVSDGQIAAAEKTIATLKSAGALARRFARLEDLQLLWRPAVPVEKPLQEGVFGHLRKDQKNGPIDAGTPPQKMTWSKFSREVLPKAEKIEFLVPGLLANYLAFVTAVNPDAPFMLQWDNHVSHYVCVSGSRGSRWNLQERTHVEVTGVALAEHMWGALQLDHHKRSVTFILKGALDLDYRVGGGMFPETMRAEYHGIRKVLERHFTQAPIEGKDESTACGICLPDGGEWAHTFRVTAEGVRREYLLDRWD